MAATATEQILMNNSRNLVLKYTIAGTTGDTTAGILADISAIDADLSTFRILKVAWALTGCSINLLWDATANVAALELSAGEGSQDYSQFGGIPNNAGVGVTGDLLFTTTGYTAGGDGGHIILYCKKQ